MLVFTSLLTQSLKRKEESKKHFSVAKPVFPRYGASIIWGKPALVFFFYPSILFRHFYPQPTVRKRVQYTYSVLVSICWPYERDGHRTLLLPFSFWAHTRKQTHTRVHQWGGRVRMYGPRIDWDTSLICLSAPVSQSLDCGWKDVYYPASPAYLQVGLSNWKNRATAEESTIPLAVMYCRSVCVPGKSLKWNVWDVISLFTGDHQPDCEYPIFHWCFPPFCWLSPLYSPSPIPRIGWSQKNDSVQACQKVRVHWVFFGLRSRIQWWHLGRFSRNSSGERMRGKIGHNLLQRTTSSFLADSKRRLPRPPIPVPHPLSERSVALDCWWICRPCKRFKLIAKQRYQLL